MDGGKTIFPFGMVPFQGRTVKTSDGVLLSGLNTAIFTLEVYQLNSKVHILGPYNQNFTNLRSSKGIQVVQWPTTSWTKQYPNIPS